jgi:hypothetical protein
MQCWLIAACPLWPRGERNDVSLQQVSRRKVEGGQQKLGRISSDSVTSLHKAEEKCQGRCGFPAPAACGVLPWALGVALGLALGSCPLVTWGDPLPARPGDLHIEFMNARRQLPSFEPTLVLLSRLSALVPDKPGTSRDARCDCDFPKGFWALLFRVTRQQTGWCPRLGNQILFPLCRPACTSSSSTAISATEY